MNVGKKSVGKLIGFIQSTCFFIKFANEVTDNEFLCKTVKIGNRDTKLLLLGEAGSPIYRIRILSFFIWASEENPLRIWNVFKMQKRYAQPYGKSSVYCTGRGNVHQFKSMKILYWNPQPKWTVRCRQGTGSSTISSPLFQAECAVHGASNSHLFQEVRSLHSYSQTHVQKVKLNF